MNKMLFPHVATYCIHLKTLKLFYIEIPDSGLEALSNLRHQLKSIELRYVTNHLGLDKLIKANTNLVSLHVEGDTIALIIGDILEMLGLHCSLLQICRLKYLTSPTTDMQIETFTKGCPNLKELTLDFSEAPTFKMCQKLLHSLGNHNSALEKLHVSGLRNTQPNIGNSILTREQCQSLQRLSNGCPLLKEIYLSTSQLSSLSTSDISYLVNNSIHLENIFFGTCNICDDELIIAKEADSLKYLKHLYLSYNPNITDKSIMMS